MLEWLFAPIDPDRAHQVGVLVSWHARAMVAAWGALVPMGILSARFFKVMPGQDWPNELDNRVWWHAHRGFQYLALFVMLAGLGMILLQPTASVSATSSAWLHHWLGWAVLLLGAVQYLAGWLRGSKGGPTAPAADGSKRGDHYDMTLRRQVFENLHKALGYGALLMATATILTGLWQANAPRWMWVAMLSWWAMLALAFWLLQRRGMAIDTYQAIWGPGTEHPGNHRRPIGFGVRRRRPER
jgi:uncharacterized membrane protein